MAGWARASGEERRRQRTSACPARPTTAAARPDAPSPPSSLFLTTQAARHRAPLPFRDPVAGRAQPAPSPPPAPPPPQRPSLELPLYRKRDGPGGRRRDDIERRADGAGRVGCGGEREEAPQELLELHLSSSVRQDLPPPSPISLQEDDAVAQGFVYNRHGR
ncbi:hypothetical protein ACQ4PT_004261 [Festuca glaucescens]